MLTKNRVVLVVKNRVIDKITYEAIELIHDVAEAGDVIRRNKTPMIEESEYEATKDSSCKLQYPVLYAPEYDFGPEFFIEWCNKNGFDSGEFMTGSKYNTFDDQCFLCDIAEHRIGDEIVESGAEFNRLTPRLSDLIIYESENFFVKVELGCMIKGMLMINPKQHILSAAAIPDEMLDEYFEVMRDTEFLLKLTYGVEDVVFFEHGSAPDGISTHQRSIVHAHLHVAPGVRFDQKYLDDVCMEPVEDIRDLRGEKYLTYQLGTTGKLWAVKIRPKRVYVARQYPRQIIAELNGIDNRLSNWRVEPFDENMVATFADIYETLVKFKCALPPRIVKNTECFVTGYHLRMNK